MQRNGLFIAQLLFTLLVCAFMFVPVVLSVMAGFTANYIRGFSSGLTLRWLFEVWGLYKDAIGLSLVIALACLAVTLIVGVPTAYFLAKANHWTTRLVEELLVTPLAVPGLAIALGLIITYGGIREFRSHWTFILVGHVLYTLPFMVRSVLAVLSSIDLKTLEEGAASLGASYWQRFFTIGLPNARSGIVAGALMVLTLSVGEFNITWMLHTPINKTVPVGLADSYASMRIEIGSAYTTVFLLMIVPLLLLIQYIAEPARPSRAEAAVVPQPAGST
ncbi:MAG: binding-protein-dependent transport system inner rane component [Rhodospirillales bacterium]|nr:binding-protein-dependent transport system inner rane component [Rhodospirillales bacterium]